MKPVRKRQLVAGLLVTTAAAMPACSTGSSWWDTPGTYQGSSPSGSDPIALLGLPLRPFYAFKAFMEFLSQPAPWDRD